MLNTFPPSTRIKVLADLLLVLTIVSIQSRWIFPGTYFFSSSNLVLIILCLGCWFFSGRVLGLYKDLRDFTFSYEWTLFIKTLVLYSLIFCFVNFQLLRDLSFTRTHLVIHCSLIFLLMPIQKLAIRLALKRIRNSDNVIRKVLIVGAGDPGLNFYHRYVKNHHYGYKLAGFVDDVANPSLNGHYLGKTSDIEHVIHKYDLDDIIVTTPITNEAQLERIITVGEKEGKRVRIIPHYSQFGSSRMRVETLGSQPIITLRSLPLDFVDNKIYKRIFDIVFSSLVIVCVLSWLVPIISLIIKLTSKGHVFFKQERWGLNNKPITCYKFRSMVAASKDVDANGNYQQASKGDPRVTPIGRFLRKTSLDELPQFFNVLFGSMSVSGPRPHPVPLNMISKGSVENYMMRHWVKPGITGWAQVNGYRGETRDPYLMQKRVESDLWYIENWTFWLDLQIILQTLVNIVKGEKNAF